MALADWLFPRRCVGCKSQGAYICADCVAKFQVIEKPICPICRGLSLHGFTHAGCQTKLGLDGVISAFAYQGMVKRIIGTLKYRFVRDVNQTIVDLATSLGDTAVLGKKSWLVLPVPLHPRRQRWRGFNQAAYLAKALADYGGFNYQPSLLTRIKNTQPQMKLSGAKRQENMRDAFCLTPKLPQTTLVNLLSQPVLLVDDVYTTGATLKEACKPLKRAGFNQVWGWTVAQVK